MGGTAPRLSRWDIGSLVGGKYELRRLLGTGAMGSVYEARHVRTGKKVAIKVLTPEMASNREAEARFFQEARAAGAIDHENVVDIYDVDTHGDAPFIVMELLRGESLAAFLHRRGPLAVDEALQVIVPALEGIEAAHRDGIVHRDLKPDNIFLCRDRNGRFLRSKVLDFGISKVSATTDASHLRMTAVGTLMGTPLYMAPEQLQSATQVDARTDVYALGCVLFEMLTGRPPFVSENVAEIFIQIATTEPPPPSSLRPGISRAIDGVILRALAKTPGTRFESMRELARALLVARENGDLDIPREMVAETLIADREELIRTSPDRPVVDLAALGAGDPRGKSEGEDEHDGDTRFEDEYGETSFFDRAISSTEQPAFSAVAPEADSRTQDLSELMARLASSSTGALDDLESSAVAWGYGRDDETGTIDLSRLDSRTDTQLGLGPRTTSGATSTSHATSNATSTSTSNTTSTSTSNATSTPSSNATTDTDPSARPRGDSNKEPIALPMHGLRPIWLAVGALVLVTGVVLVASGGDATGGEATDERTGESNEDPSTRTTSATSTPSATSRPAKSTPARTNDESEVTPSSGLPTGIEPPIDGPHLLPSGTTLPVVGERPAAPSRSETRPNESPREIEPRENASPSPPPPPTEPRAERSDVRSSPHEPSPRDDRGAQATETSTSAAAPSPSPPPTPRATGRLGAASSVDDF